MVDSVVDIVVVVVQLLSCIWLIATPWTASCQAYLSSISSWSLLKLMSVESVMPSNHLILCCPLLLLPSISPSIRIFSNESTLCIRWPKYWSFSFNISPFNEYSGLISFRIDYFDLLAIPGTLKSLLQHHSSKASILQHSVFFMVDIMTIKSTDPVDCGSLGLIGWHDNVHSSFSPSFICWSPEQTEPRKLEGSRVLEEEPVEPEVLRLFPFWSKHKT